MFGQFVKKKRLHMELTLRDFCRVISEDPSNWSKIERSMARPPTDNEKLSIIALALGIPSGSPEEEELRTLASVSAGRIPDFILNDEQVMASLPAFLRTIGNVKPSSEELDELIARIRREKP